ncbi:MAG: LPS assembly lipoprotein LptE [Candidatus Omnitrophica bacterium]|nr:LPS assembly lipoprotein LptE [Candidatus Omnitrophota bacterium]MCM8791010.1 LPS assembly lipoprotein LptE [Candidatus Omnitrophota bacterium]
MNKPFVVLSLIAALSVGGCGYTTRSVLSPEYKSIEVENVKNSISVTAEQDNLRMYRGYRPGMEVELTKAIIDAYLFDGNLKVSQEGNADLILVSELVDFKREPLRYDANDNIEEYRIKLYVNMELQDANSGATLWKERGFSGEATYSTSGTYAKPESAAVTDAIKDLARRIVERTIEAW